MNLTILIILLAGMIVSTVMCVMLRSLLKAAIALAFTSAILSIVMFVMGAPLAGVFELSVCAGLITVIFISAISMTGTHSKEEIAAKVKVRLKRFIYLPFVLIILFAILLVVIWPHVDGTLITNVAASGLKVQDVLWGKRQLDIFGQIAIILAGVFGIVVFFKERDVE